MDKILYQCDPKRNVSCTKENCYQNGGPCFHTENIDASQVHLYTDNTMVEDPLTRTMVEDPLTRMLEMQAGFQDRVDPRFKSANLEERAAFLRDHFVFCDQELQEMLYEVPFFKHWKDYSKMTPMEIHVAYDTAKDELIDAWHFFMNLALGLGMDADEFYKRYLDKHKENIRRQDDGYDHTMKHI